MSIVSLNFFFLVGTAVLIYLPIPQIPLASAPEKLPL